MKNIKQMMLDNSLGRMAMKARTTLEIFHTAYCRPEKLGFIINDHLATTLITQLCASGKTFVDVGAHIGSIMAAVSHHDPSINIVGVEAIPEKVTKLRQKFPTLEIHSCAVGESEGTVSFYIRPHQSGYSSLIQPKGDRQDCVEVKVPIKRLDTLIQHPEAIDAIKIDVEGAELGVLRGSSNIMTTSRPMVMFESGPEKNPLGYTKADIWQYFSDLDYLMLVPNRVAHNGESLSKEGFIESHLYPRRTTNYFAIPKERRENIKCKAQELLHISAASLCP